MKKIETKKFVKYIRGIYYKKEEWLIKRGPSDYHGYHREDGPAVIYYYKDKTIAVERWYNNTKLTRPTAEGPAEICYYKNGNIKYIRWTSDVRKEPGKMISYYENGNVMSESISRCEIQKSTGNLYLKCTRVKYYEDGAIEEEYDSGTFIEYDSKIKGYANDSYTIKYYENGNIKAEIRGINKDSSLDKPVTVEYDINGNILKEKYYIYGIGYITKAQLDKYNKQLQSKRKLRTLNPKTLDILYYLAKKYNYKDKIEQIEELLTLNKLTKN